MKDNRSPRRYARMQAAAAELDISVRTIRRWVADGRIAAYRVGPRAVRVDLDEVAAQIVRRIPTAATHRTG